MIAAVVADRVGFEVVYGTGYWLTASRFRAAGRGHRHLHPDARPDGDPGEDQQGGGDRRRDTGYGGLLNVHHTVRGYEAAGVSAIQFEDQEFPRSAAIPRSSG